MNERLEEDMRNLKETDFMGPTTREEWNLRKKQGGGSDEDHNFLRKQKTAFDFSSFDQILNERKSDQLKIAKSMFGR